MDLFTIDTTGTNPVEEDDVSSESGDETDEEINVSEDPQSLEHTDEDEEALQLSGEESEDASDADEMEDMSENDDELEDEEPEEDTDEISDESSEEEQEQEAEEPISISKKLALFPDTKRTCKKEIVRPRKNVFDFSEVYINCDINDFGKSTEAESLKNARKNDVDKLLATKSIAHQPGFDQMDTLIHSDLSKQKAKKLRKAQRDRTKGDKWFNMPATEVTEEVKRDLEVLQMRSILDPKTFYKKNDLKVLPKYFQLGRVMDNAADFYHSRIPKKERKRTMVEELMADAEFQQRSKKKFKEIVAADKQQFKSKAHKQAKRLKRRKN